MTVTEPTHDVGVAQALIKGTCPICALLREFQNELIESASPEGAGHLCNFHAWAVAHATPANSAIGIFARSLDSAESYRSHESTCGLCSQIRSEEQLRIREMAKELTGRATLSQWMLQHGSICLHHAPQLRRSLPTRLQPIVTKIVQRQIAELKQELEAYRQQLDQGINAGGGVLGKAAELLVSQRGILR